MPRRFLFMVLLLITALFAPVPAAGASYHLCPLTCDENLVIRPEGEASAEDIRALQRELHLAGYYRGPISGVYDTVTAEAVRRFKSDLNLPADAVVETRTWEKLSAAIEPVATEEIPPPTGEVAIVIDVRNRTLTIMSDGRPYRQFPCAVGKNETPSPTGNWKIKRKAVNWGTGFGTRWMGLSVSWGIYGIHGTNKPGSIGSQASHGCFRMFNRDVETIYPWVKVGTPVYVIGNPLGPNPRPELVLNSREPAVLEMQRTLSRLGYYHGPIDGIFGPGMEKAVIQFRKDHGLRYDNRVLDDIYEALGL
ncbi:MAG: peptidoglycan-binding protein [Thermoanaerobacterales bacterium]|nr:peptidoglycan-binding protein [Bacillota bacterium]MDI6907684.1 peptidoglycan-binding protein [Thermoanaerobacterales bacterium]